MKKGKVTKVFCLNQCDFVVEVQEGTKRYAYILPPSCLSMQPYPKFIPAKSSLERIIIQKQYQYQYNCSQSPLWLPPNPSELQNSYIKQKGVATYTPYTFRAPNNPKLKLTSFSPMTGVGSGMISHLRNAYGVVFISTGSLLSCLMRPEWPLCEGQR